MAGETQATVYVDFLHDSFSTLSMHLKLLRV